MALKIKLKKFTVSGVFTTSDLEDGEVGINQYSTNKNICK